jgi:hypothetical protein
MRYTVCEAYEQGLLLVGNRVKTDASGLSGEENPFTGEIRHNDGHSFGIKRDDGVWGSYPCTRHDCRGGCWTVDVGNDDAWIEILGHADNVEDPLVTAVKTFAHKRP